MIVYPKQQAMKWDLANYLLFVFRSFVKSQ